MPMQAVASFRSTHFHNIQLLFIIAAINEGKLKSVSLYYHPLHLIAILASKRALNFLPIYKRGKYY